MAETSSKYYHFAWNENERSPALEPPQISTKDRVAKILRETELEDVPDLVFRSPVDSKALRKAKKSVNDPAAHVPLRGDRELFSIDDDDDNWDVDGELNTNEYPNSKQGSSSRPAPDKRFFSQQRVSTIACDVSSTHQADGRPTKPQYDTYLDDNVSETVTPAPSGNNKGFRTRPKQPHTAALLPMDNLEMEMELDSDDDDVHVHTSNRLEFNQPDEAVESRDTHPIITVSQAELAEKMQSRRRKINILVAVSLIMLAAILLAVAIYVTVHFAMA